MMIRPFQSVPGLLSPLFDELVTTSHRMSGTRTVLPPTDLIESDDEIRIVIDLPGWSTDGIELSVERNLLTIRGEREESDTKEAEGRYLLSERRMSSFSRSFILPRGIDQEGIEARLLDGVLTIEIPKTETAKRREIAIQNGGPREIGPGE